MPITIHPKHKSRWIKYYLWRLRNHKMSAEEIKQQKISFAYGNCKLSNDNITREIVEKAYEDLYGKE